jgi:hypothetical protein
MEEIQAAKPVDIEQGFTPQMGEQLQGISTAKDAEGREFYKLTPQAGGGYGLSTLNAEGGYTPVEGPGIQPQRVTEFLGQRYEGGLTPERMDAIRTRAMANAVADPRTRQQMLMAATAEERAAAGEARAQQGFETQQKLAGLQLGKLEDEAARTAKIRKVDDSYNEWFTKRVGDREPTHEDTLAGMQYRARELAKNGLLDESVKSTQNYLQIANAQIELQTRERTAAIGKTIAAAASGDLNAVKDFYNKFVPDGGQVTKVSGDAKSGYTIERTDLSGHKLPPVKIGDLNQLSATIETFNDPKALRAWSQQQFSNNIATQTLQLHQESLKVQKAYKDALVENAADARKLQSVREFTDGKGKTVLLDISKLPTNPDGTLQLPEGVSPKGAKSGPMPAEINAAKDLVGKTRPGKLQDGKPVRYTYETALEDIMAARTGEQAGSGMPEWGARPPAAPTAPAAQPAAGLTTDEDYRPVPARAINPGYGTLDGRVLLRTPSYGAGLRSPNFTD